MTDEIIPTPEVAAASEPSPAIVDETCPPENDAEGSADAPAAADSKGNNKKGKYQRKEKEQVPIEELYDLSQPIKRVERPSKDEHEAAITAIDSAIDTLRAERKALQTKIDAALGGNKQKSTPLGRERDALNKLKNRKGLMIEQKRQIRTRLEIVKSNAERLIGQQKNARSGMKFTNVADIEKEISSLQRKQEQTSMSLADEKKLIKEIEALQASKRTAAELQSKQGDLDSIKVDRKSIQADLNAKDREIDAIQKEIDGQSKVLKELTDKQSTQRGAVDELIKGREDLKAKLDEKFKEKNELRTSFREGTNDWYQNQRAVKAQRQLQYDEEEKSRKEEKAAFLKKKEEEELAKTPYEEEMHLCDYLADYLTKAYLTDASEEAGKKAKAAAEKANADVIAVKDDPFAGFKATSRNSDDDLYFGKGKLGKGGKKGKIKSNKSAKPTKATFSLNLDLFDQFGMLSLSPPTSLDAVSASVDELNAKKQWYTEQPRGSVPTARDIRKANEASANKAKAAGGNAKAKGGNRGGKNKGNFDISNDSEFVPLGIGSSAGSGANASWGQKLDEAASS
eukprot:CAMPEP_0172331688 /NCGR_PEP_ID=MMETSP1058-20130122/62052_1 /TAXON_ID=83371 /ORGANISM="Detonula confervacea, Strain CCMP 353" /LENGTH=567 /DNA_ID=CAMNT_0013048957 /DNA_START=74 /DNA_END=1777 /DNA_ORIENTATION=-